MEAIYVEKGAYKGVWIRERPPDWRPTDELQFQIRVAHQTIPDGKAYLTHPLPKLHKASPENWKLLIGLVVCGLAQKVNV
jgi:hypothetical protein